MGRGRAHTGPVIVVTRHRIEPGCGPDFLAAARAALSVLAGRPGFRDGTLGRATDQADLWVLTTRWRDVGSYRRALSGYDAKLVVVPLLSTAVDEPSAFEVLYEVGAEGSGVGSDSALAADAANGMVP